jgi:hypothetical protein
MHNQKLKTLVTEAVVLDRLIAERSARLEEIKAALIKEAEYRSEECTATEGGGLAWTAEDETGNIARVNFPAPALKSSIKGEGKTIEKVRKAAGTFFTTLFNQAPKYVPVDTFRPLSESFLGKGANKLIKLCTTDSSPRVSFETKEKSE